MATLPLSAMNMSSTSFLTHLSRVLNSFISKNEVSQPLANDSPKKFFFLQKSADSSTSISPDGMNASSKQVVMQNLSRYARPTSSGRPNFRSSFTRASLYIAPLLLICAITGDFR